MESKKIEVVIPTKGRADIISTHKYISNSIVCVSQSEHGLYKEKNPDMEICIHPDSVIGLPAKRQWIYEKFKNVFMADDDLKGIRRTTCKPRESDKIGPELAYEIIQNCGNLAALCGAYLFGFSNWPRPEHYHGHEPYSMTGFINGAGLGMIEGAKELKFNGSIKASQDYWIAGLNAHHYRKAFIDRRYCMSQSSFGDNIGGCAGVRTNEAEEQDYKLLKMYFGSAIRLKKQGNTLLKHKFSKKIVIPF